MSKASSLLSEELKKLVVLSPDQVPTSNSEESKERYLELISSLLFLLLTDPEAVGHLTGLIVAKLENLLKQSLAISEEAISILKEEIKQVTPPSIDSSFERAEAALQRVSSQISEGGAVSNEDLKEFSENMSFFAARQLVPVDSKITRQSFLDSLTALLEDLEIVLNEIHTALQNLSPNTFFVNRIKTSSLSKGSLTKTVEKLQKTLEEHRAILESPNYSERIGRSSTLLAQQAALIALLENYKLSAADDTPFQVYQGVQSLAEPENSFAPARITGTVTTVQESPSGPIVHIPSSSNILTIDTESGLRSVSLPASSTIPNIEIPFGIAVSPSINLVFSGAVFDNSDTLITFQYIIPIIESVDGLPASAGTGRIVYNLQDSSYYQDDPGSWTSYTSGTISSQEALNAINALVYLPDPSPQNIFDLAMFSSSPNDLIISPNTSVYREEGEGVFFRAELFHGTSYQEFSSFGSSPTLDDVVSAIDADSYLSAFREGDTITILSTINGLSGNLRSYLEVQQQPQHLSSTVLNLPTSKVWGSTDSVNLSGGPYSIGDRVVSSLGSFHIIDIKNGKAVLDSLITVDAPDTSAIWGTPSALSYEDMINGDWNSSASSLLKDVEELQNLVGEAVYDPSVKGKAISLLRSKIGDRGHQIDGPAEKLITRTSSFEFSRSQPLEEILKSMKVYGFDKAVNLLLMGDIEGVLDVSNASYSLSLTTKFSELGLNFEL